MGSKLTKEQLDEVAIRAYNEGYSEFLGEGRNTAGGFNFGKFLGAALFNKVNKATGKYFNDFDLGDREIYGNYIGGNFSGGRRLKNGEKITKNDILVKPISEVDEWARSHDIAYNLALSVKDENRRKRLIEAADKIFIEKYEKSEVDYTMITIEAALLALTIWATYNNFKEIGRLSEAQLQATQNIRERLVDSERGFSQIMRDISDHLSADVSHINPANFGTAREAMDFYYDLSQRYGVNSVNNFVRGVPQGNPAQLQRLFFDTYLERYLFNDPEYGQYLNAFTQIVDAYHAGGQSVTMDSNLREVLQNLERIPAFNNIGRGGASNLDDVMGNVVQTVGEIGVARGQNLPDNPAMHQRIRDFINQARAGQNFIARNIRARNLNVTVNSAANQLKQLYQDSLMNKQQYEDALAKIHFYQQALNMAGGKVAKRSINSMLGYGAAKAFELLLKGHEARPDFGKVDLLPEDYALYIKALEESGDVLDGVFIEEFLNEYYNGIKTDVGKVPESTLALEFKLFKNILSSTERNNDLSYFVNDFTKFLLGEPEETKEKQEESEMDEIKASIIKIGQDAEPFDFSFDNPNLMMFLDFLE